MPDFTHLHVHTQYSILDGAAKVDDLINMATQLGMPALAITDHGNMHGAIHFHNKATAAGIKPILGCEIYIAEGSRFDKKAKKEKHSYHLILLAKNLEGYRNLARLSSKGYLEGFYYTPRIDKELLRKYHKGLIATSACLGGEIPHTLLNRGRDKAEEVLQEYLDIFGDDFYIELQRHGWPEQDKVNPILLELAQKYKVKVIAANDVHFIRKEDYEAHKILICLNTGKDLNDSTALTYSGEEYLKSPDQMISLFQDIPEAISNTREIVDKVEVYDITTKKVMLPHFPLPKEFRSEDDYLRHLSYKGAKTLYPELTEDVASRLDFELKVIKNMGFAGYFLVVQDFINAAKKMGVLVGPGRGSAAGSVVAYCIGITAIDPIRYNLLFERFLNPERISMPDIDVDFDDEGRERVLKYVVDKYGEGKVAQIVTFGTMAAKLAIRDVARVLKLPLPDADRLAKLVPDLAKSSLAGIYKEVPELGKIASEGSELERKTLQFAQILEGSARQTGTHACGVIIGAEDLIDHIPLSTAKDSDLMVTQYEGKLVESAGMLKMDFLGLKTLSIIKEAIHLIKQRHGILIDIARIPDDDIKTFELYQRGDTVGTFQFESEGMRQYLRDLKPTSIEDLIAMNALYRPGPMEYISVYIRRKHGQEAVTYPHPLLEEILKPTYGIMVYQEQIMQTAQIMAGFTLGHADVLRHAMGKKKLDEMERQKVMFIEGAQAKGIAKDKAASVFATMTEFAKYGFNRSHSAAYSVIAYQTAYLKAHYPAEYMAAVLTHNLNDIKKITQFIEETRKQHIEVLGPDINESELHFTVNTRNQIRFGMGAIKGVGEAAVQEIVQEREANGPYRNIFDLVKRINLRAVNRRCLEALAQAGAFDSFEGSHRAQYFYAEDGSENTFLDKVIRYAQTYQERRNTAQVSLFGEAEHQVMEDPPIPACQPWTRLDQLNREKEVTGFYIAGHPLDEFRLEVEHLARIDLGTLKNKLESLKDKDITFAGMVTASAERTAKNGNLFGNFTLEDYTDSINLPLFGETYLKMKHLLDEGMFLLVKARVQGSYNNETQLNIRINHISLLADALDQNVKRITVGIPLAMINPELTSLIQTLINQNKGECAVVFNVFNNDQVSITLPANKYKVRCASFVRSLTGIDGISVKLE